VSCPAPEKVSEITGKKQGYPKDFHYTSRQNHGPLA
jgi:hypothetical protein